MVDFTFQPQSEVEAVMEGSNWESPMTTFSATRLWSKFEVMKQLLEYFGEIEPFLRNNTDVEPSLRPKLLGSPQKKVFFSN